MQFTKNSVLTIANNSSGHGYPEGTLVRILKVLKKNYLVEPINGKSKDSIFGSKVQTRYIKDVDLNNKIYNMVEKLNEGDVCTITANTSNHGFEIGTIVRIDKSYSDFWRCTDKNGQYWFLTSDEMTLYFPKSKNLNIDMTKTMKSATYKVAKQLLKPNNTITTLEIKMELRKQFPLFFWTQTIVSDIVNELVQEGSLKVVGDNGIFKTYADPSYKVTTVNATKTTNGTSKNKPTVSIKSKPSNGGTRISRDKAYDLITNSKGRFFTCVFDKKNGTTRVMNGQYVKGQVPSKLGYIKIKDSSLLKKDPSNCIRNMNLQTLSELKISGSRYVIN